MALISKWVADHQWYTLDKSSEIINHCSALGLFIILTLINSQREEKEFLTLYDPPHHKNNICKRNLVAPIKRCVFLGRHGIGLKFI